MYRLSPRGFVGPTGAAEFFLMLDSDAGSPEWTARQRRSMAEYRAHYDSPPKETKVHYALFDAYIAAATYGRNSLKVLDVGCGISMEPPAYVSTLVRAGGDRIYAGIDPIPNFVTCRAYPFICGRLESLPPVFEDKFDVFLFSTSLDHFEDLGKVADAVRKLASDKALCIFWIGLHDTAAVAEQASTGFFRQLYGSLSLRYFVFRYVAAFPRLLRYYVSMRKRQLNLRDGKPLDALHFHYFDAATVDRSLKLFGRITGELRVPGSNMLFATVELGAPT